MVVTDMRQLKRRAPRVAEYAAENGWHVVGLNGRGHFKLRHEKTGRHATMACTASDYRAERNTVSWMKRIVRGDA